MEQAWEWWNRFLGGSKRQPAPTPDQFFVPPGVSANPEGHFDKALYEASLSEWKVEEDSRLRRLEQMGKLMRSTDIIPGATAGGGFRPLEQRPMITQPASLDVLDPEIKTMADFIRKRDNMFAYKGMV